MIYSDYDEKVLVKMLKKAYAAELGAIAAYKGHVETTTDVAERTRISLIRLDEQDHAQKLKSYLWVFNEKPSWWRNLFHTAVGKTVSIMCHISGGKSKAYGAAIMEKFGAISYAMAARQALRMNLQSMAEGLVTIGESEVKHQKYFMEKYNAK